MTQKADVHSLGVVLYQLATGRLPFHGPDTLALLTAIAVDAPQPPRELNPEMEVDVEVLDVSEEEARALLLSIDPLAALAETQEQLRDRLLELAPAESEELRAAWEEAARKCLEVATPTGGPGPADIPAQYLVLVTCRDEKHQVEVLQRLAGDGLECRALLS